MNVKLFFCICCLLFSYTVQCQQTTTTDSLPAKKIQPPTVPDSAVFLKVEIEAAFPGGADAWRNYLIKNLKANVPIKKKAPAGMYMVVIRFIVSKDGSITAIEPETSHGYGMEAEVMRIIKKGPKWIPASQDGRTVNAYRRQPVTFVVSEK